MSEIHLHINVTLEVKGNFKNMAEILNYSYNTADRWTQTANKAMNRYIQSISAVAVERDVFSSLLRLYFLLIAY